MILRIPLKSETTCFMVEASTSTMTKLTMSDTLVVLKDMATESHLKREKLSSRDISLTESLWTRISMKSLT